MIALVVLSVVCGAFSAPSYQLPDGKIIVHTEDGYLRGELSTSIWGKRFFSFQGIPFAQPPVGELRFKAPKPVFRWNGVRDALRQPAYCPQTALDSASGMSEDCLYLNVYVPEIWHHPGRRPETNEPLPVLVWIHGGGFTSGTGIKDQFGPDNFMNLPVVLVTVNYRLGALGFLALEHPEVTTNAGLKDQVAALRWVQDNIANFGGDPERVTIFGESAGGMSVELLMLSPMTAGLFHGAIAQSGSTLAARADGNGTKGAFRLAEVLGHSTTDRDDLVKFLRSATPAAIVQAQGTASTPGTNGAALSTFPHVEQLIQEGDEVFLPDIPEKLIKTGRIHPVPFITGVNSQELKFVELAASEEMLWFYNTFPEQFVPQDFNLTRGSAESIAVALKIKQFYFGDEGITRNKIQQLVDVMSDNFMVYAVHKSAMLHMQYGHAPVYMYLFTHDGNLAMMHANFTLKGPAHADDQAYLFYMSHLPFNPTDGDIAVIQHFTDMWFNFAQSGDPSLGQPVRWTPATMTRQTYLDLDAQLSVHEGMYKERMAFWDQLYSKYVK